MQGVDARLRWQAGATQKFVAKRNRFGRYIEHGQLAESLEPLGCRRGVTRGCLLKYQARDEERVVVPAGPPLVRELLARARTTTSRLGRATR